MTTRLQLYKAALRLCGAASISALTDEVESRRLLDEVWDDGGVRSCLEMASWNFGLRTQQLDYDPSITPGFGYTRAFQKSSDWVRTMKICSDEQLNSPLLRYVDEAGYLYCDLDTIYVQFISDDSSFGGDLSVWSGSFSDYVAAYFASQIIHRLTSDKERIALLIGRDGRGGILSSALKVAKSLDAMDSPTQFLPPGTWTRSRIQDRGNGPFRDGGVTGSLTG